MPGPDAASRSRVLMKSDGSDVRGCRLADRTGAQNDHIRFARPDERNKGFEVPPVGCRVVAYRRTAHGGQRRLIHELGGGNSAADGSGIGEQATRLIALP